MSCGAQWLVCCCNHIDKRTFRRTMIKDNQKKFRRETSELGTVAEWRREWLEWLRGGCGCRLVSRLGHSLCGRFWFLTCLSLSYIIVSLGKRPYARAM